MSFDIKVPDGWTVVKLSDLGEVNRGRSRHRPRDAAHLYNGPYPFVQTGDVKASGGRITQFSQTYSEAGLAQSRLWPTGTMCITIAANIAETGILTFPACFPDSVIGFIADEKKCNVYFIEFVFRLLRKRIQAQATGSVQDNINLQTLERLQFPIPALDEQNRIAEILGKLDDKIYLNTQTNQTLEQMAQAIFKSWFVDFDPVKAKMNGEQPEGMDAATASLFPEKLVESELGLIPEGWEPKQLKDVLELAYGKALKKTDRVDGEVPVYGSGGLTGFHNQSLVNGPGIIVGRKGTVGSVYWEPKAFYPIDTVFYVKPKAGYSLNYCHLILQNLGLKDMNTDAAVPGLNRNNAYRLDVITPSEVVLNKFEAMIQSFQSMIDANNAQNASLSLLRDTLLPKLLSGEIELDVSEITTND